MPVTNNPHRTMRVAGRLETAGALTQSALTSLVDYAFAKVEATP
jgi:hypothetical protein